MNFIFQIYNTVRGTIPVIMGAHAPTMGKGASPAPVPRGTLGKLVASAPPLPHAPLPLANLTA